MATVTEPIMTDATGQDIVDKLGELASAVKPNASDIPLIPPSGMVATNVQDGISELKQSLSDFETLEKTASGAIATFDDGSDLPMPSLKVSIEPVQSGSGDPSPTNVRPISGWNEVNVTRCGKNLCKSTIHGYVSSSDNLIVIDNDTESAIFYAHEGKTYTISSFATMNKSRVALVKTDNVVNYTPILQREILDDNVNTWTATWTGWTVWYKCSSRQTAFNNSAQVEIGDTPTTYEPYNGQTYTIDLDGTRYGGTLDVVSGVLTVDRAEVDLGTLYWTYASVQKVFYDSLPTNALNVTNKNGLCEGYKPTVQQTMDSATWSKIENGEFVFAKDLKSNGSCAVVIKNLNYTDATEFKSSVSNMKILYPLATPLTIQLTPTQVKSLLGVNNIWADTGDIELIYLTNNPLTQTVYDMVKILVEQST